jgi:hypothetical protein
MVLKRKMSPSVARKRTLSPFPRGIENVAFSMKKLATHMANNPQQAASDKDVIQLFNHRLIRAILRKANPEERSALSG